MPAITSRVESIELINPVGGRRFSVGEGRALGLADDDRSLVDKFLNRDRVDLSFGEGKPVRPVFTTSAETSQVVDVLDSDTVSFEQSMVGNVRVKSSRDRYRENVHPSVVSKASSMFIMAPVVKA